MATLDSWRHFLKAPKTLELVEAKLIGRTSMSPAVAAGPCKVQMNTLQDFSFSMTTTGSPIPLLQAINHHHEHRDDGTSRLRLEGKEADGTEWLCGWTMPQNMSFGDQSIIEGKLTSLMVDQPLGSPNSSTEFIFHADHLHPLARVMGTNRLQQKEIDLLGSKIKFAYERENKVVSITVPHSDQLPPTWTENWIAEPLRIMFGQCVAPRLAARNIGGMAIIHILPQPALDVASWSSFWRDEKAESFFDTYARLLQFIALAPDARKVEINEVTRFYDELARVAGSSRWVMSLTLAGCTEGLAMLLRPFLKTELVAQEKADSKAAAALVEKIEALEGDNELKKAAVAALRPKGMSTERTLKWMAQADVITHDQLATWRKLRNSVMHGKILYPYASQEEDARMLQLMDVVRSLTDELLKQT
ncbi:hypothetical protein [Bradyrhizobium ottawaense]|uniref:hypothetical protein n=1 Tax=Bradyrhizobium ottawaense TaxID=931866 RepID=UPI001178C978|nr:hypothetical protein [Bradyrhizobium ottawaense]